MLPRLRQLTQHVLGRLPSLIPSSCALCGITASSALCSGCADQFLRHDARRCSRCAARLPALDSEPGPDSTTYCGGCLKDAPAFDATIVAADYAAPIDQMVLGLKFGGRLALAPLFARVLRDALLKEHTARLALPTVLTAVPLSAERLAERGFNQALEIAKPLSRSLGICLDARLSARARNTQAQALLHPHDRRTNMRDAFVVLPAAVERLRGQHVGVVDDVMTTGETLNELASTLKRFGAARVTNLVFARTTHK